MPGQLTPYPRAPAALNASHVTMHLPKNTYDLLDRTAKKHDVARGALVGLIVETALRDLAAIARMIEAARRF